MSLLLILLSSSLLFAGVFLYVLIPEIIAYITEPNVVSIIGVIADFATTLGCLLVAATLFLQGRGIKDSIRHNLHNEHENRFFALLEMLERRINEFIYEEHQYQNITIHYRGREAIKHLVMSFMKNPLSDPGAVFKPFSEYRDHKEILKIQDQINAFLALFRYIDSLSGNISTKDIFTYVDISEKSLPSHFLIAFAWYAYIQSDEESLKFLSKYHLLSRLSDYFNDEKGKNDDLFLLAMTFTEHGVDVPTSYYRV